MFVFAKAIPKTLLVPFFPDTVYIDIHHTNHWKWFNPYMMKEFLCI